MSLVFAARSLRAGPGAGRDVGRFLDQDQAHGQGRKWPPRLMDVDRHVDPAPGPGFGENIRPINGLVLFVTQTKAAPGGPHQHVGAGLAEATQAIGLRIAAVGQIDRAGLGGRPIQPFALIRPVMRASVTRPAAGSKARCRRKARPPGPSSRLASTMRIGRVAEWGTPVSPASRPLARTSAHRADSHPEAPLSRLSNATSETSHTPSALALAAKLRSERPPGPYMNARRSKSEALRTSRRRANAPCSRAEAASPASPPNRATISPHSANQNCQPASRASNHNPKLAGIP